MNADGRVAPRLAESWTWEKEGLALRLHLRSGVTFHDGTPLTSAIAVEALRAAIARPGNRALYPSFSDVAGVRPDGELALVLDLSQPSVLLPEDLTLPFGIDSQDVGTGAFRLVNRDESGALLERFDGYYLGTPTIERIVIRPFDTLRTAWTSLLRDELDVVTDVPHDAVEFISNENVQVIPFERRYQFLIAFNSARQPFRSADVRRALNFAVNRQALIDNLFRGRGTPATGPLWPKHWAYDASIQPYSLDQTLAASLLENAGFPPKAATRASVPARLRFTCLLPANFSLLERVGLEVQKQLYQVGVDMQFEVVSVQEYDARIRGGRFEAVLVDLISGPTFGRPFIFWRSVRQFKGLNVFGYENAEAERLFEVLRTSTNETAVRSAARRLQRTFLDDPPALFLAWNERARAVSRRFRVPDEPGSDPLFTIWQWTENTDRRAASIR
ncbi:MAG: ABC transporter substrate-binding protein [Acidobacteria bacterium]|nr:ABC transporter substrate-binding protein [Acidobacteriota bacterium]